MADIEILNCVILSFDFDSKIFKSLVGVTSLPELSSQIYPVYTAKDYTKDMQQVSGIYEPIENKYNNYQL